MIRAFRKSRGFSLVELSIVLMIVGLLGAAILETYRGYIRTKIANDTGLHRNMVTQALVNFVTNYGRLPCPASPTRLPGTTSPILGAPILATRAGGVEVCAGLDGVISVPGHRKTSASPAWAGYTPVTGDPIPAVPLTGDPVLIGTVPYITLGLGIRDTLDGWGNRMTYAVSQYMTDSTKFNYDNGVIDIQQNQRTETPPGSGAFTDAIFPILNKVSACPTGTHATCSVGSVPVTQRRGAFLYILVSHGRDGKGAYNYSGARPIACNATGGRDQENCNDDRSFLDADPKTHIYTTVHTTPLASDTFFDDPFTSYSLARSSDKWSYQTTTSMYNKTKARVGIGVTVPLADLDVGGNVMTDSYLANEFCTPEFDDPMTALNPDKPAYCINANMIDGPDGSVYGSGRALGCPEALMRGIKNGTADCEVSTDLTVVTSGTCPAGSYVKGINATGGIVCATP